MSGVSEITARPPAPVAEDPSALPFPHALPAPVGDPSCLFAGCQPLHASRALYHCTLQGAAL